MTAYGGVEYSEPDLCYGRVIECIEIELAIEAGCITSVAEMLAFVVNRKNQLYATLDQHKIEQKHRVESFTESLLAKPRPRQSPRHLQRAPAEVAA